MDETADTNKNEEAETLLNDLLHNTEAAENALKKLTANTKHGNSLRCGLLNADPEGNVSWEEVNEYRIRLDHRWNIGKQSYETEDLHKLVIPSLSEFIDGTVKGCIAHLLKSAGVDCMEENAMYNLLFGRNKRKARTATFGELPNFWELVMRLNCAIKHHGDSNRKCRKLMISDCIAWKTSQPINKARENIIVSRPSKKNKTIIYASDFHYVSATDCFGDSVNNMVGEGYLDMLGMQCGSSVKVEHIKLNFDTIGARVWKVEPALSPQFQNRLVNEYNKLPFMYDPNSRSNQSSKRLIRFSSISSEQRLFLIGSKNTLIKAQKCSGIEKELLVIANSLMKEQNRLVREQVDSKYEVKTWEGTELLSSYGKISESGYEKHNDLSTLLCVDDEHHNSQRVTGREMQVLTFVITSGEDSDSCKVEWSNAQGDLQYGNISTGSNCVHIQGHRTQLVYHKVTGNCPSNDNSGWRLAISVRHSEPYQNTDNELKSNLKRCGITLSKRTTIHENHDRINLFSDPPSGKKYDKSNVDQSADNNILLNTFRTVAEEIDFGNQDLTVLSDRWKEEKRQVSNKRVIIGTGCEDWKTLSSARYLQKLMEVGVYVQVKDPLTAECHSFGPLIDDSGLAIEVGSEVDLATICTNHGICHNLFRHISWSKDSDKLSLIIITQLYKNDVNGIRRELNNLKEQKQREGFWVGGSGGSARYPGQCVATEQHITSDIDAPNGECHLATSQDVNNILNKSITGCHLRGGLVRVIISIGNVSTYAGEYAIQKISVEEDTLETIAKEWGGVNDHDKFFMSFREAVHMKTHLTPINRPHASDLCWCPIQVSKDNAKTIGMPVIGKAEDSVKKMVLSTSKDDILRHFMQNRLYYNYIEDIAFDYLQPSKEAGAEDSNWFQDLTDYIAQLCRCSAAGFNRLSKNTLINESTVASVAPGKFRDAVGDFLSDVPLPMPIRSYDPATLYMIYCFNNDGMIRDNTWLPCKNKERLSDMLFGIIVFRMFGRINPFLKWSEVMSGRETTTLQTARLPKVSEAKAFISFLTHSVTCNRGGLSNFSSAQFSKPSVFRDLLKVKEMIYGLSTSINGFVDVFYEGTEFAENPTDHRSIFCNKLIEYLHTHMGKNIKESKSRREAFISFFGGLVVSDVEEMCYNPFGPCNSTKLGTYSSIMIKSIASSGSSDDKLMTIVEQIRNCSSSDLDILGLEKDGFGNVVVKVNKRLIGAADAEHMLCKLQIMIIRKKLHDCGGCSRVTSNCCHPVKMSVEWPIGLIQIAKSSVNEILKKTEK